MAQRNVTNDEINLTELVRSIWHNFWIVIAFSVAFVAMAYVYAFRLATPEYNATSRFELLEDNDSGPSFGQAAGLAALAGISLGANTSQADSLEDRILSRKFIRDIYDNAGFEADPIFNGFIAEPGIVNRIQAFIFGSSPSREPTDTDLLVSAVGSLSARMDLNINDNGIIDVSVLHPDPMRAAHVANVIVEGAIDEIFERKRTASSASLNYFADELLRVRKNLDAANAAVRDYAISRNLQSADVLAKTSTQLAQLRSEIIELDQDRAALRALDQISHSSFDAQSFAATFPASSRLAFRRALRWPADSKLWEYPEKEQVEAAISALDSQYTIMSENLSALQEQARSSGDDAIALAGLEREVQVQQSIYQSIITQFEAQSLFSGFEQASGRVLERAIAPRSPSTPRKNLSLAMGFLIGSFIGMGGALLLSSRSGIIFSLEKLEELFAKADVYMFRGSLGSGRLDRNLSARQSIAFQDIAAFLRSEKSTTLVLTPASPKMLQRFSIGLSRVEAQSGERVAVLDLANLAGLDSAFEDQIDKSISGLESTTVTDDVKLFRPTNSRALPRTEEISSWHRQLSNDNTRTIILCPNPQKGIATAVDASLVCDNVIVLAERAKSKRQFVNAIDKVIQKSKITRQVLVVI